jgi:outer membrane biosynthesis protein TonB
VTEGRAIMLAAAAHLALLAGLSLTWSMQQADLPSFQDPVPVEVVDISDVPRITEPPKPSIEAAPQERVEAAAPDPAPEEAPPESVETPAPEPVPEVPAPAPKPEPKKQPETPKPEAKPEPKKQPAKPKADPATEAKKKAAERLDAQDLANLIDKSLPKARRKPLDTSSLAKSLEMALPKGARLDARATATLEQAIRAQIAPCWNPPIGGEDVRAMTVQLRIQLDKDGRVLGTPEVIGQTGMTSGNQAYARAFADSARRAVIRCAPLRLPDEYFDAWKLFELNFDPSMMT